jgi:hypothetical protein
VKQEKGFSLIEVLIAGGLMIGVVFAVQSLIANTSKSSGDLEKRLRHRDLVEDLRFAFYDNARCLAAVRALSFRDGEELGIPLGEGVARAGADLPSYGLRVMRLSLQNVQNIPQDTFTLLLPSRQLAGQYQESGRTADLVLEAQLMGSKKALKPIVVQRLTWLQRTGALAEELCFGNHDIPGRSAASSPAGGRGEGSQGGSSGEASRNESAGITLYEDAAPASGKGNAANPAAARRPFCYVTDPELAQALGRERLVEGESAGFRDGGGAMGWASCEGGRLTFKK